MRATVSSLTLVASITLAAPAFAQDVPESAESEQYEMIELRPSLGVGDFHWVLGGQIFGIATPRGPASTGFAASAELAYDVDRCRVIDVGAQVSLARTADARDYSGEQWISACMMSGDMFPTIEVEHRLQLSVTPALSAPRRTYAVPYSAESIKITMTMLDMPVDEATGARLQFFRVTPTIGGVRQSDGVRYDDHMEMIAEVEMLRAWVPGAREPFMFDLFHVDVHDVINDSLDVTVMSFSPLRFYAIELRGGLLLDADLGWGNGSIWDPMTPSTTDPDTGQTLPGPPLAQDDFLTGRFALRGGSPRLTLGAEVTRAGWPTLAHEFAIETRATAWASTHQGRFDLSAKGFAAITETHAADGSSSADPTGGGEVKLAYTLGHGFIASLTAEAAQSYYATTSDTPDLLGAPSWGVRGFAAVTAGWGSN